MLDPRKGYSLDSWEYIIANLGDFLIVLENSGYGFKQAECKPLL